jgi:ketosteroid isomerase-like protein
MGDEDVEVVRRAYEAYSKGDLAVAGSAYKSSGAPVTIRYGQVITVRDGKIVETVVYGDPADAFDAAGLTR